MKILPDAHEVIAYLSDREDQLTEWESNFVSNMTYWLRVREKEANHAQLMMLTMIYDRLRRSE